MTQNQCYDVIHDCVEAGLKTQFDYLTSTEKREVMEWLVVAGTVTDEIEDLLTWLKK